MFKTIEELVNNTPNSFKNCKADEQELKQMTDWLAKLSGFLETKGFSNDDLSKYENELEYLLPPEIKILYAVIGKSIKNISDETLIREKFQLLEIENFRIEKDVVIKDCYTDEDWFKTDVLIYTTSKNIKNPLYGIDLKNGWDLSFHKNWYWQKDGMPLFKKLTSLFASIIISNKGNIVKTKVKGINGIKRHEKAEKKFEGIFERLPNFEYYEHTIFINREYDLLGWFRAGSSIDFLIGSNNKMMLYEIIDRLDFTRAKYQKELKS